MGRYIQLKKPVNRACSISGMGKLLRQVDNGLLCLFTWLLQANPWDSNPPLGTTPNLVWPQNTTPFQTQGGASPWPNYNQQSLVPQYMAGHGLPWNQPHCQPQAGAQVHTNFNLDIPGKNNNNIDSNKNNSNLNKSGNSMTTCPCCGNMTYRHNIKPGKNNFHESSYWRDCWQQKKLDVSLMHRGFWPISWMISDVERLLLWLV